MEVCSDGKRNFPKKINKSLILLIYINMLALFDIPFSAFTWHSFLTSSLSSDPSCLQLPEQDVSPTLSYCQSFSCGSWVAQGHLNILLPLLTLQRVTALPDMAYGDTDPHRSQPGGSTGNQSSVLQELAGLKGSPLECWATVLTSIKSILKLEIWSSWELLWFNAIKVLWGIFLKKLL